MLAASEEMQDPQRRKVFALTRNSSASGYLEEEQWELIKEPDGFVIKNVHFGEYLYAAADDRAFDENNRSVFTWKEHDSLGLEGYWMIISGNSGITNA